MALVISRGRRSCEAVTIWRISVRMPDLAAGAGWAGGLLSWYEVLVSDRSVAPLVTPAGTFAKLDPERGGGILRAAAFDGRAR